MNNRFASRWVLGAVVSLALVQQPARSQDDADEASPTPFNTITNEDMALPDGAIPKPPPYIFTAPGSPEIPSSPAPSASFQALGDNNTLTPPDTDGAVGPNHVMTMLNSQVRIQDRSGTIISTVTLSNWWATKVSGITFPFDPRLLYDPVSGRWIATAGAQPATTSSAILVAVSQTTDPTGSWYVFGFQADSSHVAWADFPTVGFNRDRLAVSWNYYNLSDGTANGVGILALNKTNLYAGTASTESWYLAASSYGLGVTPSCSYGTTDSTFYLLQTYANNLSGTGYLAMFTITGAVGSGTLTRLSTFPSAPGWSGSAPSDGNFAPQLGTSVKIHNGDSRLSEVVRRGDSLWCAQTVFLPTSTPTRASVQWWQIRTNGVVAQQGLLDDQSGVTFYAYPSIAVNKFGDALIGYSRFASSQYASANYSLHALNDPTSSLESDYVIKAGESAFWKIPFGDTRNRWGDFSMTCVDPANDADFWTIQEYAATAVGSITNGSGRWGTWWAKLAVAIPGNDNFTNSYAISGASGATNGSTVRATRETGEPNHAGNATGASIWYSWTPPSNGNVILDTIGSAGPMVLAVYTGTSVSGLTLVTNDNGSAGGGASRVVFNASASTTYRIAVDGLGGAMAATVLNWKEPTTPVFIQQPQSQTKYQGDNVTFTAQAVGNPAASYQWRFNGSSVGGAIAASYTITSLATNNAGSYTVVASNTSGSATSAVAVLTVATSQATLSSPAYTNNQFTLTVSLVSNLTYIVQAKTNVSATNWTALATNVGPFTFTDTQASNYPQRFYRAVYKP